MPDLSKMASYLIYPLQISHIQTPRCLSKKGALGMSWGENQLEKMEEEKIVEIVEIEKIVEIVGIVGRLEVIGMLM